jgi:hypothetical protein
MTLKEMKAKRRKSVAIMRPLDPSDPRSPDHPCHEEQWLALAGAIGRSLAKMDFDSQVAKEKEKTLTSDLVRSAAISIIKAR